MPRKRSDSTIDDDASQRVTGPGLRGDGHLGEQGDDEGRQDASHDRTILTMARAFHKPPARTSPTVLDGHEQIR